MSRPVGIIVDGQGDRAALRKRYRDKYTVLKTSGPRGHTALPHAIVAGTRKELDILKGLGCRRAIVMIDFEARSGGWGAFCAKLQQCFSTQSLPLPVTVVVPNRMTENWYLADIAFLSTKKKYLRGGQVQRNYEGKHGKKELQRHFLRGVSYSETQHGPELFSALRIPEAVKRSLSFNEFVTQLKTTSRSRDTL